MIPLEPFLNSPKSIYGNMWSLSPWALVTWGLRQLGLDAPRAHVQGCQIVIIKMLEVLPSTMLLRSLLTGAKEAGTKITNDIGTLVRRLDRIMSRELFKTKATKSLGLHERISDKDTNALLVYLARDKKVLSFDNQVTIPQPSRICGASAKTFSDCQIQRPRRAGD